MIDYPTHAPPAFHLLAKPTGEPTLMGLDFYRRAMALAEKRRSPGMRFLHTIQTNGTPLDTEWAASF